MKGGRASGFDSGDWRSLSDEQLYQAIQERLIRVNGETLFTDEATPLVQNRDTAYGQQLLDSVFTNMPLE